MIDMRNKLKAVIKTKNPDIQSKQIIIPRGFRKREYMRNPKQIPETETVTYFPRRSNEQKDVDLKH